MIDVVLLGTLVSERMRKKFEKNGISPQPADIPQSYMLAGLSNMTGIGAVTAICSPRLPTDKECGIKRVDYEDFYCNGIPVHVVGYNNRFLLGFQHRRHNFVSFCRKWAETVHVDKLVILVYSLNSTMLKAALDIKKRTKNSVICIVVADLPEFMSSYRGLKLIAKRFDMYVIEKLRSQADKYVLYAASMADYLGLRKDQWIVVEGFIDADKVVSKKKFLQDRRKKICVYGGSLSPQYGIQKMIDAFVDVFDCELRIYGNQKDSKKYVYNDNAKYCGQVDPDEMFSIFCQSDFLINPRPSNLELTNYSFPSKTFEYMASCTPVVMARLPGVTEVFFKYLNIFDDETEAGIAKEMNYLISISYNELQKKAEDGAAFLRSEMNSFSQMKKIIHFCLS